MGLCCSGPEPDLAPVDGLTEGSKASASMSSPGRRSTIIGRGAVELYTRIHGSVRDLQEKHSSLENSQSQILPGSAAGADFLSIMEKGDVFTGYAVKGKRLLVKDVVLYFKKGKAPESLGRLYWCMPVLSSNGQLVKIENKKMSIKVKDLTDVHIGAAENKVSKVQQHPELQALPDEDRKKIFTLRSRSTGRVLDLKAMSLVQLEFWVTSINNLLTTGKRPFSKQGDIPISEHLPT